MLVIACVAIIVVGPKDLPGMLRQFGKTLGSIKRMAGDFQRQFNDALKEAELDEIKDLTSTKGFAPLEDARKSMEEFAQTMKDPMEADPQVEVAPPAKKQAAKPAKKTHCRANQLPRKAADQKTGHQQNCQKPMVPSQLPPANPRQNVQLPGRQRQPQTRLKPPQKVLHDPAGRT